MKTARTVSIAMATYNGARFIREQLTSIAAQTQPPTELVISDDGSIDETIAIAEAFAADAPFAVRISRNPKRLGFSRNFEVAIGLCECDLIFLSDQDDVWCDRKIERVAGHLLHGEKLICLHDQFVMTEDGERRPNTFFENFRTLGYSSRELVSGNCTAFNARLRPVLSPFPPFHYDEWIGAIGDALETRTILDEPLQSYRRHGGNATTPVMAEARPSRIGIVMRTGLKDPRPQWDYTISMLQMVIDRISRCTAVIDTLIGAGASAGAIGRSREEMSRLQRRRAIVDLPRFGRPHAIWDQYTRGLYGHFSGIKSALKDLLVS